MSYNKDVLKVLVDPTDRQSLQYIESEKCFYNERTHAKYSIVDNGIAVLLADSATVVSDDEHKRLSELVKDGKSITTGVKG